MCPLALPVTVVQPGFVTGGQSEGATRPSGGGGGGGEGVGRLCKVAYTNPLLPPLTFFFSNQWGAWALVPLAMPVTGVQPGFVNGGGAKRGSEATECVGGAIGRFVETCMKTSMKTTFSCTLNAIIIGVGYVKWHIYQSPTPPFLIFTLINGEEAWGHDACARERSDGSVCGRGVSTVVRFLKICV